MYRQKNLDFSRLHVHTSSAGSIERSGEPATAFDLLFACIQFSTGVENVILGIYVCSTPRSSTHWLCDLAWVI